MRTINLGDEQPEKCLNCNDKHGYAVTDNVRGTYSMFYAADGSDEGGSYGDSQSTSFRSKIARCFNCGTKLKFNINRSKD